jgi:protein-tyrosine phosphatase
MAEGVFRAEAGRRRLSGITIDSAGTGGWHEGDPPDPRAVAAAMRRGIDISAQRVRQIVGEDFKRFDLLLAMNGENLNVLKGMAAERHAGKVRLFLDFARDLPIREVADPYYGDEQGFEDVLDLIEVGSRALADHIAQSRS